MRRPFRNWNTCVLAVGLCLCLIVAGCAGIESGFNVLTFRKHPASGISAGQNFLVYLLRPGSSLSLPQQVETHADPYLQDEIRSCTRAVSGPATRGTRFGGGGVAAAVVARAGQLLLDSVYSEVETRARQIEALSQKTYAAQVSWTTRQNARWNDVSCILLVRLTKPGGLSQTNDIRTTDTGLIVLMRREARGIDGSVIAPSYVLMNNAVAVTGNSEPATVQLNLAIGFAALVNGSVTSGEQIALPQINVPLGQPLRLCEGPDFAGNRSRCPHASSLFADPPDMASALQVGISATETGSSATIGQHVAAGSEALKSIARPVREAALRRLVVDLEHGGRH